MGLFLSCLDREFPCFPFFGSDNSCSVAAEKVMLSFEACAKALNVSPARMWISRKTKTDCGRGFDCRGRVANVRFQE